MPPIEGHWSTLPPTGYLYDNTIAHLDVVGNFPGPPHRQCDPYINTYNPGWKDHPNLSCRANP
ncbi:hypothetical protein EPI10_021529 [Gossypium australe]|uniref:Uncharacterized protein n=1 Tax=Gossypium australe TaxID=47621 RepID=A0A5B6WJ87_9ROSI|nr:hypothetical protein EPI10_021529 [Gossypium australe]